MRLIEMNKLNSSLHKARKEVNEILSELPILKEVKCLFNHIIYFY